MSEWISVDKMLPEKNTLVAWIKMNNPFENGINKKWISKVDDVLWVDRHDGYHVNIIDIDATHWMPLPEPPQEQNND